MRHHPLIGANILKPVAFPWPIAPVVRHHHEHCDGGGYPAGLQGRGDPAAGAGPHRRRRVRGDDRRPPVPSRPLGTRRRSRSCSGARARSSTRASSTRSSRVLEPSRRRTARRSAVRRSRTSGPTRRGRSSSPSATACSRASAGSAGRAWRPTSSRSSTRTFAARRVCRSRSRRAASSRSGRSGRAIEATQLDADARGAWSHRRVHGAHVRAQPRRTTSTSRRSRRCRSACARIAERPRICYRRDA